MDKIWTKNSFIKYHVVILHEIAKFGQIQKYATQMHECRNFQKIRLELRNSYDVNRESSIFLLNINQLQGLAKAYLTPSPKKLDKIWTKIAKRGDLNALQTSSEFNLYTMTEIISTKIGIFPELQIILLARVFKGVNQDFQDCSHCNSLFS